MTTHILIPRANSTIANSFSSAFADENDVAGRRPSFANLLGSLPSNRYPAIDFAASLGDSAPPTGRFAGSPTEIHSEATINRHLPRSLEHLGVLIVDDLEEDDILMLDSAEVDVVTNFEILLEHPVEEKEAAEIDTWHLNKVNIEAARSQGLDGQGIRIGVLDTGIDDSHPEFSGKSVQFMEFDQQGYKVNATAWDAGSHGTHVSAIAAGNTVGVAPAASLAVAAVLTNQTPRGLSGTFAQILAGLNWLLQSNFSEEGTPDEVGVVNASLGGIGYDPYLYSVLSLARIVPGTQLIAAIGNAGPSSQRHGSPGNYDIVVGCGSTNSADKVSGFSSWGTVAAHADIPKPDMCAPGDPVVSATPGGGYAAMRGTSMASPMVSGAAALLLQKHSVLRRNPSNLAAALLALTLPIGQTHKAGRGRLDLTNI